VSSRLEDLRDLAVMLDEGKVTQEEYDIVKAELLDAPAEEWEGPASATIDFDDAEPDTEPTGARRGLLAGIPPTYRLAAVGAFLVLVAGALLAAGGDSSGSVRADNSSIRAAAPVGPAADSLGVLLVDVSTGWNEVGDPPTINGGIMTSPEPGPLDSFLYRFESGAVLAGAYDPSDGSVHGLMARASLHDEAAGNLFIHLCHLLQPGAQVCLDSYLENTGTFGKTHDELIGTDSRHTWELGAQTWNLEIEADVETIRVDSSSPS
jgi:hypothetical protein